VRTIEWLDFHLIGTMHQTSYVNEEISFSHHVDPLGELGKYMLWGLKSQGFYSPSSYSYEHSLFPPQSLPHLLILLDDVPLYLIPSSSDYLILGKEYFVGGLLNYGFIKGMLTSYLRIRIPITKPLASNQEGLGLRGSKKSRKRCKCNK
jgi:hypothetical protein